MKAICYLLLPLLLAAPTIASAQELVWAADAEGGAPFSFPDPRNPAHIIGFEVDLANALAEGSSIKIVNLSVLGAQIISQPLMRPSQKLRLALPDETSALQLTASVAWSMFEKPSDAPAPHFRVGMEFSDAVREALEDYCKRNCSSDPLPVRR